MKKAEFNTKLILAIFVVGIAAIVFSNLLFIGTSEYGLEVPEKYENAFNQYEENKVLYNETQDIIESGGIDTGASDVAIFKNAIVTARQMQSSGNLFLAFMGDVSLILGIDPAVVGIVISIVFFLITMGVIYFLVGRKS